MCTMYNAHENEKTNLQCSNFNIKQKIILLNRGCYSQESASAIFIIFTNSRDVDTTTSCMLRCGFLCVVVFVICVSVTCLNFTKTLCWARIGKLPGYQRNIMNVSTTIQAPLAYFLFGNYYSSCEKSMVP